MTELFHLLSATMPALKTNRSNQQRKQRVKIMNKYYSLKYNKKLTIKLQKNWIKL